MRSNIDLLPSKYTIGKRESHKRIGSVLVNYNEHTQTDEGFTPCFLWHSVKAFKHAPVGEKEADFAFCIVGMVDVTSSVSLDVEVDIEDDLEVSPLVDIEVDLDVIVGVDPWLTSEGMVTWWTLTLMVKLPMTDTLLLAV